MEDFSNMTYTRLVPVTPGVDSGVMYAMNDDKKLCVLELDTQIPNRLRQIKVYEHSLPKHEVKKVYVDGLNQRIHYWMSHPSGIVLSPLFDCMERHLYSFSGEHLGAWVDEQFIDFCLDQEATNVIYLKERLKNSECYMLEKVNALSNATACQQIYKRPSGSLDVPALFEVGLNNVLYIINIHEDNVSLAYIECFDSLTLKPTIFIEIGLRLHSSILVDDYLFIRVKKDNALYKYDVINQKMTVHSERFPKWDSEHGELMPWGHFLVVLDMESGGKCRLFR